MERWPGRRGRGRSAVAALPGARPVFGGRISSFATIARDWIVERLAEEAELGRPALWLPVFFGIGVAVYFAAAREPALWAALALSVAAAGLVFLARSRFLMLGLALGVAAATGGFLAAKVATLRAEAPSLQRPSRADVVGRVSSVEPRQQGRRRVTLAVERFGSLDDYARPKKLRVTLGAKPDFTAGDRISLTAYWRPTDGPVRPGGYDFARVAYFQGLGGSAFAPSNVKTLGRAEAEGFWSEASAALQRLRERLTRRVSTAIGGPEGTVAAALVTGVQGPIPQATEDELRAAGLSHILSISGLHMALIAGTLFWLARAALALFPAAALRWPVKGISAAIALAGATFYLALSGAEVATQRSYIMIAIAFLAILVGRPALAPRNFALAGLIVLALTPDALLGPSFQMSFAAVAALVAWFETRRERPPAPPAETRTGRLWRYVATAAVLAVVTTLIAGLATAPFAAYHFHRVTPFALAGNALATPLLSLVVMPSVVGGLLFAPLGLDGPWWDLMGLGLKGVLAVARMVASWPGSERSVPAFGEGALILFAGGLAWLCLWRTALRWAGAPALGAALALAAFPARPDIVIDASGRSLAARGPDGRLLLVNEKASSFAARVWLAADAAPVPEKSAATDVRCDDYGCVAPLAGGGVVALVRDARAFDEDCRVAALVVTSLVAPAACSETAAVVDRRALDATGALELTRDGASFRAVPARAPAGKRPWERRSADAPPDGAVRLTFAPVPAATEREPEAEAPVDPTEIVEDASIPEE
ncbi:ComEC/Rec2 family competence protein [Methylopila sp. M107]|uniref:ComEC/Rec2 family competence protein n=1 Tax=Methylopila sp. M107 TaxID=1101190 RepID=UPI00036EE1CF|nr:ComEC/Rec2 family competence protein [Methylopila sp. M107]